MSRNKILISLRWGYLTFAGAVLILMGACAGHSEKVLSADTAGSRLISLGNGVCKDLKTDVMWQVGKSRTLNSLAAAKEYASSLHEGGYDDWRLPTVAELYELYMTFDLHQNGDCDLKVDGTYWSDEPDLEGRVGTWELDDNCDPERRYIPKEKGTVRAIRP